MAAEYKIISMLGDYFEIYFFRDHPKAQQTCTWDCHLIGNYIVTITKYLSKVEVNIQDSSKEDLLTIYSKTLEGALKKTKKVVSGLMLLG